MSGPRGRLGTPAGDRALRTAQWAYDNLTPDDDDEPEEAENDAEPEEGDEEV